jgi:lipooligosaccharide transport system permease protein
VFFPLVKLPEPVQQAALMLPLAHAVELIRPAMLDRPITGALVHLVVLAAYAVVPFFACAALFRRRMMR